MALASQQTASAADNDHLEQEVLELNARFDGASAHEVLVFALRERFVGEIAMVSSFGADSAVLLQMAAEIDPEVPVVMVDTGKLFPETVRYRDLLAERLGLKNVLSQKPAKADLSDTDPVGMLWMSDTDACCHVRKVVPLERALSGYGAWVSGRKRFQSSTRSELAFFEQDGGRIKVNPLVDWTAADILAEAQRRDLPPHPLVAQGYPSIGCQPCTSKVAPGEDPRAGRWRGIEKTECGIHIASHGKELDGSGI